MVSSTSLNMPGASLHPSSAERRPAFKASKTTGHLSPSTTRSTPLSTPGLTPSVSNASTAYLTPFSSHSSPGALSSTTTRPLIRTKSTNQIIPRPHQHSRVNLKYQAHTWRFLEGIGTYLNSWPRPYPPEPTFTTSFPTSDSPSYRLELAFYVPQGYKKNIELGHRYPCVVNFHGGGFTLGTARDDARFAAYILSHTPAIFISVEYRLAPEFPFPTAVEDGVEVLLHLAQNADVYGIDPHLISLTGFSAGANLVFTVPLRLHEHLESLKSDEPTLQPNPNSTLVQSDIEDLTVPKIVSIISFYPAIDMRIPRFTRRANSPCPNKTLPPILTNLFDESYLPDEAAKLSPFASPNIASSETLNEALPKRIGFFLCEYDMLELEGRRFAEQLREEVKKDIHVETVKGVKHAWDKMPCPFGVDESVGAVYERACHIVKDAFEQHMETEELQRVLKSKSEESGNSSES